MLPWVRSFSYFRALGEVVVFHEPINPRGANFQQCLTAAKEAGYDDVVEELQQMQDSHQYWVEYAPKLLNAVRFAHTRRRGRPSLASLCVSKSVATGGLPRSNRKAHPVPPP